MRKPERFLKLVHRWAATTVQRQARGVLERNARRKEQEAALMIQRTERGRAVRRAEQTALG